MAVHVHTPYTSPAKPHSHPRADEYAVVDGFLYLVTAGCQQVAVYAPGHFSWAEVVPNRDAHGRFAKRS